MGLPQGSEWILIVVVVILLFGAKKLPEAARGLGRSLRIFKSEVKQVNDPLDESEGGATVVPPAAIAPAPVQSPVMGPAPAATQPYVPLQTTPVTEPSPAAAESTSVQSANEHFYGQERSDR